MKLSYHPVDGFENSKMKLKFPDKSCCSESTRDIFPSFQLVAEPTTAIHDIGSDSEDDTFCRSSPRLSEGCCSYHSDSNSEQWESGETPQNNEHELYDALGRISYVESIPTSLQLCEIADGGNHFGVEELKSLYAKNGAKTYSSGPSLAIASIGSKSPVLQQETGSKSPFSGSSLGLDLNSNVGVRKEKGRGLVVRAGKAALCLTKRSRSRKSLARTHGFRRRMRTTSGRAMLKRRRAKGRWVLCTKTHPNSGKHY